MFKPVNSVPGERTLPLIFVPAVLALPTPASFFFSASASFFKSSLILSNVIAISFSQVPAKLKEWAYAGLTFNLIFAFISHACVDKNVGYMIMPLVVLGILAISYGYNNKLANA
ncbi:MAG: hypothetical protein EOP06_21915 [Proteobacteria bacterium]|nr:MAG: hypothetical protein EOP06_21915 [Pseudomonadota bacterium]